MVTVSCLWGAAFAWDLFGDLPVLVSSGASDAFSSANDIVSSLTMKRFKLFL